MLSLPALLETGLNKKTELFLFSVRKWQINMSLAIFHLVRAPMVMFPNTDKKKQEYMLP